MGGHSIASLPADPKDSPSPKPTKPTVAGPAPPDRGRNQQEGPEASALIGEGFATYELSADAKKVRVGPGIVGGEVNQWLAPHGKKSGIRNQWNR